MLCRNIRVLCLRALVCQDNSLTNTSAGFGYFVLLFLFFVELYCTLVKFHELDKGGGGVLSLYSNLS